MNRALSCSTTSFIDGGAWLHDYVGPFLSFLVRLGFPHYISSLCLYVVGCPSLLAGRVLRNMPVFCLFIHCVRCSMYCSGQGIFSSWDDFYWLYRPSRLCFGMGYIWKPSISRPIFWRRQRAGRVSILSLRGFIYRISLCSQYIDL